MQGVIRATKNIWSKLAAKVRKSILNKFFKMSHSNKSYSDKKDEGFITIGEVIPKRTKIKLYEMVS